MQKKDANKIITENRLFWFGVVLERINSFSRETADMHLLLKPVKIEEIKNFFQQWRKEIVKEIGFRK